jgi:hypothetical protein
MPLYIGNQKRKITSGDKNFILRSTTIESKLKSFDDYILKDENNLFLTSKKEDNKKWH